MTRSSVATRTSRRERVGVDTNVLIYAHLPVFEQHAAVRAFLLKSLQSDQFELVVTPLILHELIHVITDGRRFEPPVQMAEATEVARGYLARSNVACVPCDERAMLLALDLLQQYGLGRRRVADALLTATLISHGVGRLITCNHRDFEVFREIALVDPLG